MARANCRGGFAPSPDQVAALLEAVSRAPGYEGLRNRAFFAILAATGSRVNALRLLDGADAVALPNGRLRLCLHEKGKHERREVELGAEAAGALRAYVRELNRHAAVRGWACRVRLGEPGAVWRNEAGRRWGYDAVLSALKAGCAAAGVPPCTPHGLRRAFASEAASRLPRHVVAQAGGWKGLDRLDNHYIQPREGTIWHKLSRSAVRAGQSKYQEEPADAADVALR
jgi:integrase